MDSTLFEADKIAFVSSEDGNLVTETHVEVLIQFFMGCGNEYRGIWDRTKNTGNNYDECKIS